MPPKRKSSEATISQRVEEVLKILLLGGEFGDLREYARENKWHLSDGQLRRYQRKALDLCKKRVEKDRQKLFALHAMQRRRLYALCMEAADYRSALAVLKDEAELYDLYPTKKLDVQTSEAKTLRVVKIIVAGHGDAPANGKDSVHAAEKVI